MPFTRTSDALDIEGSRKLSADNITSFVAQVLHYFFSLLTDCPCCMLHLREACLVCGSQGPSLHRSPISRAKSTLPVNRWSNYDLTIICPLLRVELRLIPVSKIKNYKSLISLCFTLSLVQTFLLFRQPHIRDQSPPSSPFSLDVILSCLFSPILSSTIPCFTNLFRLTLRLVRPRPVA